jgi:hypothetical protein
LSDYLSKIASIPATRLRAPIEAEPVRTASGGSGMSAAGQGAASGLDLLPAPVTAVTDRRLPD